MSNIESANASNSSALLQDHPEGDVTLQERHDAETGGVNKSGEDGRIAEQLKACNISPLSKDEKRVINDLVAKVREDNPSLAPKPAKGVKAHDLDNTINLAAQIAFKVVKASEKVTNSNLTFLADK